jgi:hypothetical protein
LVPITEEARARKTRAGETTRDDAIAETVLVFRETRAVLRLVRTAPATVVDDMANITRFGGRNRAETTRGLRESEW